jgi:hypothetical protein
MLNKEREIISSYISNYRNISYSSKIIKLRDYIAYLEVEEPHYYRYQ